MALIKGYNDSSVNGTDGARALVAMSVTTVTAATTTAGGTTVPKCEWARGMYITTAGTVTFKTTHRDDAIPVALSAGWHPIRVTEVTNMGAAAGFFYW